MNVSLSIFNHAAPAILSTVIHNKLQPLTYSLFMTSLILCHMEFLWPWSKYWTCQSMQRQRLTFIHLFNLLSLKNKILIQALNVYNTDCIKAASQYQSRQLNSVCLFMKKKTIKFGRADQWYDGSFNLNIPNWASQRQQLQGTEKLHQVTQWS